MSKLVLKMAADMLGITPEDMVAQMGAFQQMTTEGLALLESINGRLAAIEQKLGITQVVENERSFSEGLQLAVSDERLNHG